MAAGGTKRKGNRLSGPEQPVTKKAKSERIAEASGSHEKATNGSSKRERKGEVESTKGDPYADVTFRPVHNDGKRQSLIDLITLKNIFATQLPKMPRSYIVRLVLDRKHRSLSICKGSQIIGGICFRPFVSQGFAEIVFCAVTSTQQVKGFGTSLMNQMKEHVKPMGIEYFLTYADNFAIGYFQKQGFTKQVTMPPARWKGHIKDYDGGTLMECRISSKIDYSVIRATLVKQRECVLQKVKEISNSHVLYDSLTVFQTDPTKRKVPLHEIKGVVEAGWQVGMASSTPPCTDDRSASCRKLQAGFGIVLKKLAKHEDSWPFREPVDKAYLHYYEIITHPMDLSTMEGRLNNFEYRTKSEFVNDFHLIINNCRRFNPPDTQYFKCANKLEQVFETLFEELV